MSLRERTRPSLGIIEPCLPSPAKAPPSGPGWIHEIKHDGFRIMARRDRAGVRLITRNGNDFTSCFTICDHSSQALAYVSWGCQHPRKKAAKAALVFEDWNGPTSSQRAVPEANKAYSAGETPKPTYRTPRRIPALSCATTTATNVPMSTFENG